MPLLIELPVAGVRIKDDFSINPERMFEFPTSEGNFVSTGVVSNDEFVSTLDGDPVVKTFDNFTVNLNHIVRPTNRCKGMFLRIRGNLVVDGRISMTARGCLGEGRFVGVDLTHTRVMFHPTDIFSKYKNVGVIPAVGGNGGASQAAISAGNGYYDWKIGNPGGNSELCSGGGGAGNAYSSHGGTVRSGAGAAGTSFSGGAGGGCGCNVTTSVTAYSGVANGGAGGAGRLAIPAGNLLKRGAGGGAGNPGGVRHVVNGGSGTGGETGTGGLMILFVDGNITIGTNGSIDSKGSNGGTGETGGGGGSGGGTILVVHRGEINDITKIVATGGNPGNVGNYAGGRGGNGAVRFISV